VLVIVIAVASLLIAAVALAQPGFPFFGPEDLDGDGGSNGALEPDDMAIFFQAWIDYHANPGVWVVSLPGQERFADLNKERTINWQDAQYMVEAWINPLLYYPGPPQSISGTVMPSGAWPTGLVTVTPTSGGPPAAAANVSIYDGTWWTQVQPGTYFLKITATGYTTYDSSALTPQVTYTVPAGLNAPVGTITLGP